MIAFPVEIPGGSRINVEIDRNTTVRGVLYKVFEIACERGYFGLRSGENMLSLDTEIGA
jgi:hypothetical protein